MILDLKTLNSALEELEKEKGISKEQVLAAIEHAFAAAYKKEYGKKGQIVRAQFNPETGDVTFTQVKIVVDESTVYMPDEEVSEEEKVKKSRYNPEQHIFLKDAKLIKSNVELGDEIEFPLESKEEFGRIAAQTAKQVIMQKIRYAEREATIKEFGSKLGQVVTGFVQRFERGNLYVDLGKAVAVLPFSEQIPGERYRQGERVRALLYKIDPEAKGAFLKLSRTRNEFLIELFKLEAPEIESGVVEIKAVVREPGKRAKIAAISYDERIDPVGTLVGQRGVRVSTVTSELGGEKIDVIEYSEDPAEFVANALSPAEVLDIEIDEENRKATVVVSEDQQSLAIGRGGQNVRLAAKLTGYSIDIVASSGETLASSDGEEVEIKEFEQEESAAEEAAEDSKESKEDTSKEDANEKEVGREESEAESEEETTEEAEGKEDDKGGESAEGDKEEEKANA